MTDETPRRETVDEWIRRLSAGFDELTSDETVTPGTVATQPASAPATAASGSSSDPMGDAVEPPGHLVSPVAPLDATGPNAFDRTPTIGQWGRIEDPLPWAGAEPSPAASAPPAAVPARDVAPAQVEIEQAPEALLRPPAPEPVDAQPVPPRSRLDWPERASAPEPPPPPPPVQPLERAVRPLDDWQAKGHELKEQILSEPVATPPPLLRREEPVPIEAASTPSSATDLAGSWRAEAEPEPAPAWSGPPDEPPPPRRRSRNPIDRWTEGWPHPLRVAVDWLVTIAGAVAIVLLVKAYVINPYRIPSSSMEPTLHCRQGSQGCTARFSDRVLANRFIYHFRSPKRGDIVVFDTPEAAQAACGSGGTYVKRLIGLPGETIEVRVRKGSGYVFINGKELSEPYLKPERRTVTGAYGPFTIPQGNYFMMGDNRGQSCDSRSWGTVPRKNIIGKVFMVYWPPNRISFR
jgi:signal peptidase I